MSDPTFQEMKDAIAGGSVENIGTLAVRIKDLKEMVAEKFDTTSEVNAQEHLKIWEQVKKTNGTVRLHEKIIWALGGALAMMSPTAITTLVNFLLK